MSNLVKPYQITVWDDLWDSEQGKFIEHRLGIIGADTMETQSRAIEPNFTRNVNGVKKLTFKMYARYKDSITGEDTKNPFIDWLISERKVKLFYDNEWHDFVIKNIVENSSNYLYTYQLEDALVQELSKNGFGITLDTQLMNNMGTANELAEKVLAETDWTVSEDSEVFVQTIDEALVYLTIRGGTTVKHIKDQADYHQGVIIEDYTFAADSTVLGFYSSCVNKPHRFQFIYIPTETPKELDVSDKRTILNKDCQYYIDYNSEEAYTEIAYTDDTKYLDRGFRGYLPTHFSINAVIEEEDGVSVNLSTLYRGRRYGFAQQSIYAPVLDRYVSMYEQKGSNIFSSDNNGHYQNNSLINFSKNGNAFSFGKNLPWAGIQLVSTALNIQEEQEYELSYIFKYTSGALKSIGGHCSGFKTITFSVFENRGAAESPTWYFVSRENNYSTAAEYSFVQDKEYKVVVRLKCLVGEYADKNIYIQPNRGDGTSVNVTVSNIQLIPYITYYGYEHVEYKSPALTQNLVSNSLFTSTSGWTGTYFGDAINSTQKAEVESVFGRFVGGAFIDCISELAEYNPESGTSPINENNKTYLKITFKGTQSRVINSGPFDNRTLLENMTTADDWAMRTVWKTTSGTSETGIVITLGEYDYNIASGGYAEVSGPKLTFGDFGSKSGYNLISGSGDNAKTYQVCTATKAEYTDKEFKKGSNVRLIFAPPSSRTSFPVTYYLEEAELFKAAYTDDKKLIVPDEQASGLNERVFEKTYRYFLPSALDNISSKEELKPATITKTPSYATYKPKYNDGAQKVRSITAKESNYFNILQSIAETFEAWLQLRVSRDGYGGIINKEILFRNYIGNENHAGFKYGVNLKDIQRTYESKNIVTKLYVKQNSNQYGKDGFCTIARAGTNPSGETSIYDFQYFQNTGLMNAADYLNTVYLSPIETFVGPDKVLFDADGKILYTADDTPASKTSEEMDSIYSSAPDYRDASGWYKIADDSTRYYRIKSGTTWGSLMPYGAGNIQGYFSRLRLLNTKIQEESEKLSNMAKDLTKYEADLELAEAGAEAAENTVEETEQSFEMLTGSSITSLTTSEITSVTIAGTNTSATTTESERYGKLYYPEEWYLEDQGDLTVAASINTNKKKCTITVTTPETKAEIFEEGATPTDEEKYPARSFKVWAYPTLTTDKDGIYHRVVEITCTSDAGEKTLSGQGSVLLVEDRSDVKRYLKEYAVSSAENIKYSALKTAAQNNVNTAKAAYKKLEAIIKQYVDQKALLNQRFFSRYSRFIQEGTWVSEEYIDDEKYFLDAQSVMYNSCYPQVAYQINVLELSKLPGYELFTFGLGDRTYVEDPEFFGSNYKEKVVITELSENLDDPSKNSIKVQNFKNQFQDLFQKITATVQQAKYSTGAYEKAVALAEAGQERKRQFLTDALDSAAARLTTAGQQSVSWGNDGITVKSVDSPCDAIRMVGGAILLSKQDKNGKQKWVTGVTSDGISANLITAGTINAGEIAIMNYDEPVFRWDAYGLTAFDATWKEAEGNTIIDEIKPNKFVRFDKFGLYGIDKSSVDGNIWRPRNTAEINDKATFYLNWDGLQIAPQNSTYYQNQVAYNVTNQFLRLGRVDDHIYNKWDSDFGPGWEDGGKGKKFTKVMSVGEKIDGAEQENIVMYSDGTLTIEKLKLPGTVEWTASSAPSKMVYARLDNGKKPIPPQNGTSYNQFLDNYSKIPGEGKIANWHKVFDEENDQYMSRTEDGGRTWSPSLVIQGRDVISYKIDSTVGTFLNADAVYEDGEDEATLTARIFVGIEEIDPDGTELTYTWYINDVAEANATSKNLTIKIDRLEDATVYFYAVTKESASQS